MKDKKAKKTLIDKKEKQKKREENLKIIKECALQKGLADVLISSKDFGNTGLKNKLKVQLKREKLGISVDQDLYQTIKEHPEGYIPQEKQKVPSFKPHYLPKIEFIPKAPEIPVQVPEPQVYPSSPETKPYIPSEMISIDTEAIMGYNSNPQANLEIAVSENVLPILSMEQEIIETIKTNQVTIISGETGCGKSTQIPIFLLENGFTSAGRIGITEPRRIAAVSLSSRVSSETRLELGKEISYQVRYDSSTLSSSSKIKFMTDGIMLKELFSDFLLKEYSVIIIDEAHERGINTDLLIGLLSRVLRLRAGLRVIIMSATISSDYLESPNLFPSTARVNIESRQYPVSIHFSKSTKSEDFLEQCLQKVIKIHRNLPPGGILVFVPGKKDIFFLKSQIKSALNKQEVSVQGLYSMLPLQKQIKIFTPPENKRLIVISTNVAETSITIPSITYVVDSGLEKLKVFSNNLQVARYVVSFISQASAQQRAGRAGRTGPGHCYRLYTSAAFHNVFPEFREPDICRFPLASTVLQLKALGVKNVLKFPFPTRPPDESILAALEELFDLGAIEETRKGTGDIFKVTEIGRKMAEIPIAPRYAKMLLFSQRFGVAAEMCVIVAGMEVSQIFDQTEGKKELADHKRKRSEWFKGRSDCLCVLKMVLEAMKWEIREFCKEFRVIEKSLNEVFQLTVQIFNVISEKRVKEVAEIGLKMPDSLTEEVLQKAIVAGLADQICVKVYLANDKVTKHVPYLGSKQVDQEMFTEEYKQSDVNKEYVFVHPSSYFFSRSPPDVLAYQQLVFTQRPSLINVTEVKVEWLYEIGKHFIQDEKVENENFAIYDEKDDQVKTKVIAAYGKKKWRLPSVLKEFPEGDYKYFYFLKFLMEGKIFGADFARFWKVKIGKFTDVRIMKVQKKLKGLKIASLKRLREEVMKENQFLIEELGKMSKEEFLQDVRNIWKLVNII